MFSNQNNNFKKNKKMETIEKIRIAAEKANSICFGKSKINRVAIFATELAKFGLEAEPIGDAPAKGAAFSVMPLKNRVRVNVRCGYGRHNYAPCVEISI